MTILPLSVRFSFQLAAILIGLFGLPAVASVEPIRGSASAREVAAQATAGDPWWKNAVIYEVYPRSFGDTDGDGVGDLNGVRRHLGYLQDLGVDAIWLAPIYPSPQVDFGYDISDYTAVDPQYGTLRDFDRLLAAARRRDIRIIVDIVLNHSSDKSPWFRESASSTTNPKADWYVWSKGIPASSPGLSFAQRANTHAGPHGAVVPPNNWKSAFGGPAWTWSAARGQFYYHKFYPEQPDLNWRNPEVERAMFGVMRFWLDRGVAGFRLDAISALFEDPQLANDPEPDKVNSPGFTWNLPEVHGVMKRLRKMADSYPGQRVLIGEVGEREMARLDLWYGSAAKDELHLPMDYAFGFPVARTSGLADVKDRLSAGYYRRHLTALEAELHGSRPFHFFDNHDQERSIDRFGDGRNDLAIARLTAALLFMTPATVQMYYGAEIGMVTTTPARIEDVKDPVGRASWPHFKGRDGERTPMQWTGGPQAGFSTNPGTWLPIPPSAAMTNVETQRADPDSLLNWNTALIALRRSHPALRSGGITMIDKANPHVLSFLRTAPVGGRPALVMLNMSADAQTINFDAFEAGIRTFALRTLLASPAMQAAPDADAITLPPFAVWIAELRRQTRRAEKTGP